MTVTEAVNRGSDRDSDRYSDRDSDRDSDSAMSSSWGLTHRHQLQKVEDELETNINAPNC